jgi:hypothetical protein
VEKLGLTVRRGYYFWLTLPFAKQFYSQVSVKISSPFKVIHLLVVDESINDCYMIDIVSSLGKCKLLKRIAPNKLVIFGKKIHIFAEKLYNFILIYANIYVVDSVRFGQTIKQNPRLASIPLILMRSTQEQELARQCLDLGFVADLVKPVKASRLFDLMIETLETPVVKNSDSHDLSRFTGLQSDNFEGQRLKILLAEDNVVNQKVALKLLENLGYTADVVTNGAEVIQRLQQMPYDVVLMDCQMPILDGYQASQGIRRRWTADRLEATQIIRGPVVIAITANAMSHDEQLCLDAGMDDYISKPVRMEQLRAILTHWTQKLFPQSFS